MFLMRNYIFERLALNQFLRVAHFTRYFKILFSQVILGTVFKMRSAWCLRHISHYELDTVLLDCNGISRWPMVGLSVRDRKPAQGISKCIVLNGEDSTRTVIGGLRFCYDFYQLHLNYYYNIILILFLERRVFE